MISKLHYISQGATPNEHLENILKMCSAGAEWVQLRLKNESFETVLNTARAAKEICEGFQVKLIINDFPEVVKEMNADGVHLGKNDCCPSIARKLLGPEKIIGGTANTLEDCESLYEKKVDYIGLGPLRFTRTKKNLSPVLGIKGYGKLVNSLKGNKSHIPLVAIGGITAHDVPILAEIGIHGVAISSWLTNNTQPGTVLREIHQQFSKYEQKRFIKNSR